MLFVKAKAQEAFLRLQCSPRRGGMQQHCSTLNTDSWDISQLKTGVCVKAVTHTGSHSSPLSREHLPVVSPHGSVPSQQLLSGLAPAQVPLHSPVPSLALTPLNGDC